LRREGWHEATAWNGRRLIPARREVGVLLTRRIGMVQKEIAAGRANEALSHGPATPPGRERIRTTWDEPSLETPPGTRDVYEKIAS